MSNNNDFLAPDGMLNTSDSLLSPNGLTRLSFLPSAQLNLFVDEIGVWSSHTVGGPNCYCVLQAKDGNLCVYPIGKSGNNSLWSIRHTPGPGSYLRVMNSGIAGIFSAKTISVGTLPHEQPWGGNLGVLWAGQCLTVGKSLRSPNLKHILALGSSSLTLDGVAINSKEPDGTLFATMQTDGNFVLYDFSDKGNKSIWDSGSSGGNTTACHLGLADSGQLMVFKLAVKIPD